MRMIAVLGAMAVLVFLSACKESEKGVSEEALFNAYLGYKRITVNDESHREELLATYRERQVLADAAENAGLLDPVKLQAELDDFRREMIIGRYFEAYMKGKVSDADVRKYYDENKEVHQQRQINVKHVLVRTHKNMSESERKAKRDIAQEAYSQLKAGARFSDVATKYSDDKRSAMRGGNLGWLTEGTLDKQFSERVFELKKGELTEPFQSAFGYHVVEHLDGPKIVKQSFENSKGRIRHKLKQATKEQEKQRLLDSMK